MTMSGIFTVAEFVAHVATVEADIKLAEEAAIVRACKIVRKQARDLIGHEQPFWPPLKEATIAQKKNGNTPLLETGEMRDSIKMMAPFHEGEDVVGYVGSNNDKAVWHELGTRTIPPRPFLSSAASMKEKEIVKMTGDLIFKTIINGGRNYRGTFKALRLLQGAGRDIGEAAFSSQSDRMEDFWNDLESVANAATTVLGWAIDLAEALE